MKPKSITVATLAGLKAQGQKIACLTCYDAACAQVLEAAGVEVLLVGDSLGMVLQGHSTTLPVSLEHMVYHSSCVARGRQQALLVVDLPFLSYRSPEHALESAARLVQTGGAQMVKLEGGVSQLETVRRLTRQGVPVCGHLGLLPQSVHVLGGYRVQGRAPGDAQVIREDALALQEAGASLLVLECVPMTLAAEISGALRIPVIGIGAGPDCDGQVLVLHDLLGITPVGGEPPRFVKNFLAGRDSIRDAVAAYVAAVKAGAFPTPDHGFE